MWHLLAKSSHKEPWSDFVNVTLGLDHDFSSVLARQIVHGDFRSVIDDESGMFHELRQHPPENVESLIKRVKDLKDAKNSDYQSYSSLLNAYLLNAIVALNAYIQANFTGPFIDLQLKGPENIYKQLVESCFDWMITDGEQPFKLSYYPGLLVAALTAFDALANISSIDHDDNNVHTLKFFAKWWYSRALIIKQSILSGVSASIYNAFVDAFPLDELDMVTAHTGWSEDTKNQLLTLLKTEQVRAELVFGQEVRAKKSLKVAVELSGLTAALTGVKGKRTKFQQHETSQIVYLAKSSTKLNLASSTITAINAATNSGSIKASNPTAIDLNSDLLLEKTSFNALTIDERDENEDTEIIPRELQGLDPNNQPALNDLDTALILLHVMLIQHSTPLKDPLVQEELTAMVNRIINAPESSVNWSLFSRSLWIRSLLEADSPKTVERGTLQIQSLVEEHGQGTITSYITSEGSLDGSVEERLRFIHQLFPLPRWELDKTLAERFMAIGAVKSATEVYERLQLWSDVALCYAVTGDQAKADDILRNHLEKNPKDARAWCIWGDMTEKVEYWNKSWEVGKYASAKRALGRYFYNPPKNSGYERDLSAAIKHFKDSLTVNPLNQDAWFTYGCIGLEMEQWELAAEGFTRCVSIDDRDSKSWSNLASALLQMHKKPEAFTALQRAIRADADMKNWRIWDNFIRVAIDMNDWSQAVMGVTRLIAMRGKSDGEKALDLRILERLAQTLIETDAAERDNQYNVFTKNCIDLFINKIPPLITTNARLWKIVARVHVWLKQPWNALDDYEKAFRIYFNSPDIETDEAIFKQSVDACEDLVDAYVNFGDLPGKYGEDSLVCKDWKFKARSAIRSLSGKVKVYWEDTEGWDRLQSLKDNL